MFELTAEAVILLLRLALVALLYLFLGAVADSFPMDDARLQRLQQVAGSFGDEPGGSDDKRDHGSGVSNREWIFRGYTDNDTNVCNTFTVPSDQVD